MRVLWFRAVTVAGDESLAIAHLRAHGADDGPEWTRHLLWRSPSVGTGHVLKETAMRAELVDFKALHQALERPVPQDGTAMMVAMEAWPLGPDLAQSEPGPIIPWGAWASQAQRNLLNTAMLIHYFYEKSWGVKDAARAFKAALQPAVSKLHLYPLYQAMTHTSDEDAAPIARAVEQLADKYPERLPAWAHGWAVSRMNEAFAPVARAELLGEWIGGYLHLPAAYAPAGRSASYRYDYITLESHRQLIETNPWSYELRRELLYRHYPAGQEPDREAVFGPLLDYDFRAMRSVAVAKKDKDVEAAEAYEQAFASAQDQVWLASKAPTMVAYHLSQGNTARAGEIAACAAEVYSHRGLSSMVFYLQMTGKPRDAIAWAAKIKERYDNPVPFAAACWHEHLKHGDAWAKKQAEPLIQEIFPRGMEALQDGPMDLPAQAVAVDKPSPSAKQIGLKEGAIIVAVDGWRVENTRQYDFLRQMQPAGPIRWTLWTDAGFKTVEHPQRELRPDFRIKDFTHSRP